MTMSLDGQPHEPGTALSVDQATAKFASLLGDDDVVPEQDRKQTRGADGRFTPKEQPNDSADEGDVDETNSDVESDDESPDEGDESQQRENDSDAEPESTEAEPLQFERLEDLAKELEIPLEDLLANLKHKVKVNGEELEVNLSELASGYQKDRDYRAKTEALSRDREAFEQHAGQRARIYQQEAHNLAGFINEITSVIVGELNSAEMAQLRQEDPQQWIIRREDYNERLKRIEAIRHQAAAEWQARAQRTQQEQISRIRELAKKQAEALQKAVPEWGDGLKKQLNDYLTGDKVGFKMEEIGNVLDHRLIVLAHKARLYDEQQAKAAKAVKEVKKAPPKVTRPTPTKTTVSVKRDRIAQLKQRAKKSGHIRDAAAAIEALL